MTKRIKLLVIAWLIGMIQIVQAQVTYTYDANGNRTARSIIVGSSQPADSTANNRLADWELKDYQALGTENKEKLGDYNISIYPNPTRGAFAVGIDNMPAEKHQIPKNKSQTSSKFECSKNQTPA